MLVLLIFPSFVFFGIQGYSGFSEGGAATVAKVDGQSITRAEWDQAHQRQVERLRRQMPNVDVKLFDNPSTRRETLETLVNERLLAGGRLQATTDRRRRASAAHLRRGSAVRCVSQSRRQPQPGDGAGARHEQRRLRRSTAPGAGHAAGAARRGAVGHRAGRRGRQRARCAVPAPHDRLSAIRRQGLCGQDHADRRRDRGVLQGARGGVHARPSRRPSTTWCSTSRR